MEDRRYSHCPFCQFRIIYKTTPGGLRIAIQISTAGITVRRFKVSQYLRRRYRAIRNRRGGLDIRMRIRTGKGSVWLLGLGRMFGSNSALPGLL
ncbi:hypothetical protein O6P43_018864 [Quillaja saponaria]|uniref:Uncharacterized protein n=1 Tax=Quillaja saponaria TaxID=32244 RepID=A0AAD7LH41_QUISA|nr:hypothetical protein O6P43_018864 [Quillaja saponaria]